MLKRQTPRAGSGIAISGESLNRTYPARAVYPPPNGTLSIDERKYSTLLIPRCEIIFPEVLRLENLCNI